MSQAGAEGRNCKKYRSSKTQNEDPSRMKKLMLRGAFGPAAGSNKKDLFLSPERSRKQVKKSPTSVPVESQLAIAHAHRYRQKEGKSGQRIVPGGAFGPATRSTIPRQCSGGLRPSLESLVVVVAVSGGLGPSLEISSLPRGSLTLAWKHVVTVVIGHKQREVVEVAERRSWFGKAPGAYGPAWRLKRR